jgi:hypothetical protein
MDAMSTFDWIALVMCSYLVGLQVGSELHRVVRLTQQSG